MPFDAFSASRFGPWPDQVIEVQPTEPCWLGEPGMFLWRSYIVGSQMLCYELHREFQERHGVLLSDYEILSRLSEHPEHDRGRTGCHRRPLFGCKS
jgi:hypothetical protein